MKGKVGDFLPKIKQRLMVRYTIVDCLTGTSASDMEYLAEKNASKYDVIVACGGDGTLHLVVNGVMKSGANPIVGVLPFGTCNDVAKSLHIPTDLDQALDCLLRLNTIDYDLMYDGENYGVYALAAGYLTKCSYRTSDKVKKRVGRFAYVLNGLKSIFKFRSLPMTIVADGVRYHDRFAYCLFVNGEYTGGFRVNKGEDLHNNKVKMVLIRRKNWFASLCVYARLFIFGINNIKKSRYVNICDVNNVTIENHSNTSFIFDGEKCKFLKKQIVVNHSIKMITK